MAKLAVSLLIAILPGFGSHRASLCTVRAVGEILASLAKAALWAVVVSLPTRWLTEPNIMPGALLHATTPLGGFLFGVGAAVNSGCSFSTLGHVAERGLSYLGDRRIHRGGK